MNIVGVTGTNGKTTCVHLICNLVKDYINCASFGTLGIKQYVNNHCLETKTALTTLGYHELHKNLAEVAKKNCQFVAMEVSSHGLDQKRTANVNFSVAVFTILSLDHLDYHKTMEHYFQTKVKLFTDYTQELKYAIINLEDQHGLKLIEILLKNNNPKLKIIGFSTKPAKEYINIKNIQTITCEHITFNDLGIQTNITTPWGVKKLNSSLLGIHNLSNLLASIAACMCSFDNLLLDELIEKCNKLTPATGRLQHIPRADGCPQIIIDYAHTPDALEKALKSINLHYKNKKICCVFGCGGNRDTTKRPKMLEVADYYCDVVILTQDNSRLEDPTQIIADILSYKPTKLLTAPIIEMDRKQAIHKAIKNYHKTHIILIAGKGHETKQFIGDQEYPFCDKAVAEEALNNV